MGKSFFYRKYHFDTLYKILIDRESYQVYYVEMTELNLNKFFEQGGSVRIYFSNSFTPDRSLEIIKGMWFFSDKNGKVLPVSTETSLIYNNQLFDIIKYYELLKKRSALWEKEHAGLNFPDIIISKKYSHIKIYKDMAAIINIKVSHLFNNFDFILNHELGHLIYESSGQKDIVSQKFSKLKGKFSYSLLIPLFTSVGIFLFQKMFFNIFILDIISFVAMAFMAQISIVNFLSIFNVSLKLKNFSKEFYADYYGLKYSSYENVDKTFKKDFFYKFSSFTHPSNKVRKIALDYYKYNSLDKWENPVETNLNFYLKNNIFESVDGTSITRGQND